MCVIFFRAIRNDSLAEFPPGAAVLCVERDKKREERCTWLSTTPGRRMRRRRMARANDVVFEAR